jgi:hypothetical protein
MQRATAASLRPFLGNLAQESRHDCNAAGAMATTFGTRPRSRHLFRWSLPLPAAPAGGQCSASPLGPPEQKKD